MRTKVKVIVQRRWADAEITATCSDEVIGVSMPLDAFLKSVAIEMGSPATTLTRAQLLTRLQEAAARVQAEMKNATRYVV